MIAGAIIAPRANLLMVQRMNNPVPWDQFDIKLFQQSPYLAPSFESIFQGFGNDAYTKAGAA
jgi:hypothetical protein